jgi:hypothetical protein
MRRVRLHIGELVLHGFDPRDRHAIADAVRAELARGGRFAPAPRAAHVRDVASIARSVAREVRRAIDPYTRGGRQ